MAAMLGGVNGKVSGAFGGTPGALPLNRGLVEKRLYPAIHCLLSATRREDLLYHPEEWERVQLLRKAMALKGSLQRLWQILDEAGPPPRSS